MARCRHTPILARSRWLRHAALCAALAAPMSAVLLLAPQPACAQSSPSERDKQRARDAVVKGDELTEKGKLDEALAQYQLADGIMAVPFTRMKVASAYVDLGQLLRGREVARSIDEIPLRTNEPAAFIKARNAAKTLIKDINALIAVVTVALRPDRTTLDPATVVTLDGEALGLDALAQPLELEPGEHVLAIRAPGYAPIEHRLSAAEGQRSTVELKLVSEEGGGEAGSGGGLSPISPVAWVGFSIAGAGVIAGAVTGAIAASRASDLKALCSDNQCFPEQHAELDNANLIAHISTASFAVAGGGAVLGLIGLLALSPTSDDTEQDAAVRITPYVTPTSIGLTGRF